MNTTFHLLSSRETTEVADSLNNETFKNLLKGNSPGIQTLDFLPRDLATFIAQGLKGWSRYESTEDESGILFIGVPLVEYKAWDKYLSHIDKLKSSPIEASLFIDLLIGELHLATGRTVKVLALYGRMARAGIFRNFRTDLGAGIHLDILSDDCSDFKNHKIEMQFSCILHLQCNEHPTQGATVAFDRAPNPEDKSDPLFIKSEWEYSKGVVEGVEKVFIPAIPGALTIIRTDRYHCVNPGPKFGKDRRISWACFGVILEGDETIYLYS